MFSVAVVIPNYNNEKYLEECVESVIHQTYPLSEIVIYDDCSTDNSMRILRDLTKKDKRIKVIEGTQNCGVSFARDTAIRACTSDYICTLDADDFFYEPTKIENEVRIAERVFAETNKKVIVFSQTVDVDEEGRPLSQLTLVNLSGAERFKIVTRLYRGYMPRDYLMPKDVYLQSGGYNKAHSLYEDWELNIKLLGISKFIFSHHYGTAYRHKSCGLSSASAKLHLKAKTAIFKEFRTSILEKIAFYGIAYVMYFRKKMIKR